MAYRFLDDADHEFRAFMVELIFRVFKVSEEALNALPPFLVGSLFPVPDALCILEDVRPVSPAFFLIHRGPSKPCQEERALSSP